MDGIAVDGEWQCDRIRGRQSIRDAATPRQPR